MNSNVPSWLWWGLGAAALACAAAMAFAPPAPAARIAEGDAGAFAFPQAPPPPASLPERLKAIRAKLDYARWLAKQGGSSPEVFPKAVDACRAGLAWCEGVPEAAGSAAALREALGEAEERQRRRLDALWGDAHRFLTLREWAKARGALREIRRTAPDPRSLDHRRARRLLELYAAE